MTTQGQLKMLFKVNRRINYYNDIVNYHKNKKKHRQKTKTATEYTRFFFTSNTFILQTEMAKIKQMLSNTLRVNFCYLKTIHILHPCYHPKIIGHILKNKQKNKCVCIHEIIRFIVMKMKMKMKNILHRYNTNMPRSRHKHEYIKYENCLSMMMPTSIKQHLSNI